MRRRRISRREREARQRRLLVWGMTIAGALVALVLIGGIVNEYVIKPRTVLASVGGTEIRRRDYWKVRAMDLFDQANQYQQFAQFVGPDQQQQYLQLAQQAQQDFGNVWGNTDVDETTLQKMIDDQVYLQNLDQLGLELTDAEVATYALNQFAPANAPLAPPSPSPTLIPARAEWATQTAVANETPSPAPTSASLPPPPGNTAVSGAAAIGSPVASPAGTATAATPVASPAASPVATPNAEQARATAEAGYTQFREGVFEQAHMSRADYERLIARPRAAREKVAASLATQVGQSAEQVHAAHILVETRDLAQEIFNQVNAPGADFRQIAAQQSTDDGTAPNGGDLGWFAREEMVPPFADAAFTLTPGEISEPVETQFGWHIVQLLEHDPDRALTDQQIEAIEQARTERWLADRTAETRISSDIEPTPTPGAEAFQPPAEAPPTPTPAATPAPPAEMLIPPAVGTPAAG